MKEEGCPEILWKDWLLLGLTTLQSSLLFSLLGRFPWHLFSPRTVSCSECHSSRCSDTLSSEFDTQEHD